MKLGSGVRETTTTSGTGTVTLTQSTGYVRFSDAFSVGDLVSYAINDGINWEWGVGTVGSSHTLLRTTPQTTLVSGVYTSSGATAISLSGSLAYVIITVHDKTINLDNLSPLLLMGA